MLEASRWKHCRRPRCAAKGLPASSVNDNDSDNDTNDTDSDSDNDTNDSERW